MKRTTTLLLALCASTVFANLASAGRPSVDFPLVVVGGAIELTGGGTIDARTGTLKSGGQFRAIHDIVSGPFSGLKAGEGTRWEVVEFLPSVAFRCSDEEEARTVVKDRDTVVMKAVFFTRGEEKSPSFTAHLFVSTKDKDPARAGVQNVWVEGVGCSEAQVAAR